MSLRGRLCSQYYSSLLSIPSRASISNRWTKPLACNSVAKCYHYAMSQPVKISDELILDARLTAEVARRSIAGQIEYWAQLGRAIEPMLEGARALALCRAGATKPLSECLASVDSVAGRKRVVEYLESGPFPHYRPVPDSAGLVMRVDQDGTRTVGRFVGRRFRAVRRP